jgi:NADH-ubiquinone oxidoreductase chain 6
MNNITNNFDLLNINDVYNNGFTIEYLDILSILAIFTSILVITNKNPVISVLFLIGLFLSISVYLILIGLTFIGISYLLVYIGAVSMLFLFILMLIDIRISELHEETTNSLSLAFIMGTIFYYITNKNIVGGVLSKDNTFNSILDNNMSSPLSNS